MTTYSPATVGISKFHWWYAHTKTQASSPGYYSAAVITAKWLNIKQYKFTIYRYFL
jgi:hypothetical protein